MPECATAPVHYHLAIGDIQRSCQTMQIKLAAQRRQQVIHFLYGELFFCQTKQDVFFYRQAWKKQRFLGNEINAQLMSMNWR